MCNDCIELWKSALPEIDASLNCLLIIFTKWKRDRCYIIGTLCAIADEISTYKKRTNIAKLTGSSVGLVGAGMTLTGLALTPITLSASNFLTVTGLGVSLAGGATSAASAITDWSIKSERKHQIAQHLESHQKLTASLCDALQSVCSLNDKIKILTAQECKFFKWTDVMLLANNLRAAGMVGKGAVTFASQAATLAKKGLSVALSTASTDIDFIAKVPILATATRALTTITARGALVAVGMCVDLFSVGLTAKEIADGSQSQFANACRKRAGELDQELDLVNEEMSGFVLFLDEHDDLLEF